MTRRKIMEGLALDRVSIDIHSQSKASFEGHGHSIRKYDE